MTVDHLSHFSFFVLPLSRKVSVDDMGCSLQPIMDISYWPHLKTSCLAGSCYITPACVWAATLGTQPTPWRRWTTNTACWARQPTTTARGRCSCKWTTRPWTCLQSCRSNENYRGAGALWAAFAKSVSTASCSAWPSRSWSWLHIFWRETRRASS